MSRCRQSFQNSGFFDHGCIIDSRNRRLIADNYSLHRSPSELLEQWSALAIDQQLEKIWVWVWQQDVFAFLQAGFILEGIFPPGSVHRPSACMAFFPQPIRGKSAALAQEDALLQQIQQPALKPLPPLPSGIDLRLLTRNNAPAISALLGRVFATYPTPVDDPTYLRELMDKGCLFAGAFQGTQLLGVAAAYPDNRWMRCEITDCATLPEFRGLALTERIIGLLEEAVAEAGPSYTLFTLARATSYAMNRVFFKRGYCYQGRLINNCHIAGDYEDMNLWVKPHAEGI